MPRNAPGGADMGSPADTPFTVRPLTESTWPGFAALIERDGSMVGGCWCMAFHQEGSGRGGEREINRARKQDRVDTGNAHAALVFAGGECCGWCQFGSVAELPRIKSRAAYDKTVVRMPDWRIGCTYVGKGFRRQGVSAAALNGALDLIARDGGGVVEGYPEDASAVPAGFLFNGAITTYEQLGFTRDRMIGKHRWVMTRTINPVTDARIDS